MPRIARLAPGGIVSHVLNRGNGRQTIFRNDADSAPFLDPLAEIGVHPAPPRPPQP